MNNDVKNAKEITKKESTSSFSASKFEENLVGNCIVYNKNQTNSYYQDWVIYIYECNSSYIKGIIINKLLFGSASIECRKNKKTPIKELKSIYEELYQGGSENPAHGFVLYPKDEYEIDEQYSSIHGDIAVSTSFGILQDIMEGSGPNKKIIAMGHCSWKRGELEWQIFNNEWLIAPCPIELIFDTKYDKRWQKARILSGINLSGYIKQSGLA